MLKATQGAVSRQGQKRRITHLSTDERDRQMTRLMPVNSMKANKETRKLLQDYRPMAKMYQIAEYGSIPYPLIFVAPRGLQLSSTCEIIVHSKTLNK